MTNISSGVSPDVKWALRPGASCPRFSFLGTGLPVVGSGIGESAVVAHAAPRVRGKVALVAPPQTGVVTAQLGQAYIYNYMTSANADGEGASGPPTYREPA